MKSCEQVHDLLSPYIDSELNDEEETLVQSHLKECENCRKDLAHLQTITHQVSNLAEVDLPSGFHEEIMQKIQLENSPIDFVTAKSVKNHNLAKKNKKRAIFIRRYTFIAASILGCIVILNWVLNIHTLYTDPSEDYDLSVTNNSFALPPEELYEGASDAGSIFDAASAAKFADTAKSHHITLNTENIEMVIQTIDDLPGYNTTSEINYRNDETASKSAYIQRTVDWKNYQKNVEMIRASGVVIYESEEEVKLTAEILNTEAALKAKNITLNRLSAMLENGPSLQSLMAIEQQLNATEQSRDNLKNTLNQYYAAVSQPVLHITIQDTSSQEPEETDFFDELKTVFFGSIRICATILETVMIFISAAIAPILIVVAILFIILLISKKTKGRKKSG